jgi:hypothetical protein
MTTGGGGDSLRTGSGMPTWPPGSGLHDGLGGEEYTVPHWDVIDVAHRRVRATSPAGGLLLARRR